MLVPGALILALASAVTLYGINYDTRLTEASVETQEASIDQAREDIAVLKAERAHLARPSRIEPLARAQGLRPPSQEQIVGSPAQAIARATTQVETAVSSAANRAD
jgi:cell division protein FtsL